MKGIRRFVMFGLIMALLASLMGCATPTVSAASGESTGASESDFDRAFPPQDDMTDLSKLINWNVAWKPSTPRAPSEAEYMEAGRKYLQSIGVYPNDVTADLKKGLSGVQSNEKVLLVPAVNSAGMLAMVGTGTLAFKSGSLTLSGLSLAPAYPVIGGVILGAVAIGGTAYIIYVYAKLKHTKLSHYPDSDTGKTWIRTIMKGGPGGPEKCYKAIMKSGETRWIVTQKVGGANHGNTWLMAVWVDGAKVWKTTYPFTGGVADTSVLVKAIAVVACSMLPPSPPIP